MILKRYVLTKDKRIIDVLETGGFVRYGCDVSESSATLYSEIIHYGEDYPEDDIITAHDIIYLIEVGDLVETRDGIMNVEKIKCNGALFILCRDIIDKNEILAIYKRQINGDFIRYEYGVTASHS